MTEQAEVLVIDAPDGAAAALGAYRPQLDHTHLMCRWPGELASAFTRRVGDYLRRLRRRTSVVSLTLVLGDGAMTRLIRELGGDLALALAPMASLTLVGAGASHDDVVAAFEALRQLCDPSVSLDAWFGPGWH
jgi:hypothetical protein